MAESDRSFSVVLSLKLKKKQRSLRMSRSNSSLAVCHSSKRTLADKVGDSPLSFRELEAKTEIAVGITGSFRPIDNGEWSEQAYLKPLDKLFGYITSHNRSACKHFFKENPDAINGRDHLGRTPLQLALLCSAEDICTDLIELGARMKLRMVDGRNALHLAAQMGLPKVVEALLTRSKKNQAESPEEDPKEKEEEDVEMNDGEEEVSLSLFFSRSEMPHCVPSVGTRLVR